MNGDTSWGQFLFTQQVDSRPAVPRLILLLVHCLTRDLGVAVVLNFSAAIASAAITLMLLRKTNAGINWPTLWAAAVFFNLSFFSTAQWVNWNWHDAILSFLPNVFFALGWLINISSFPPVRRSLLVSACCALSSFSFSGGLVQWFVLIPLTVGLDRREKIRVLSLHFAAALIVSVATSPASKLETQWTSEMGFHISADPSLICLLGLGRACRAVHSPWPQFGGRRFCSRFWFWHFNASESGEPKAYGPLGCLGFPWVVIRFSLDLWLLWGARISDWNRLSDRATAPIPNGSL